MKYHLTLLIILLLAACSKDEKPFNLTDETIFREDITSTCFSDFTEIADEDIVIRTEAEYLNLQEILRQEYIGINCDTASLPIIDFSKYTLLGKLTQGGGCSANYDREVIRDNENKEIRYSIAVEYVGACYMFIQNWNWACVPKFPNDYSVVIHTEDSYEYPEN